MANRKIYLDLDGVMADFDGHYEALFGPGKDGSPDEAMWKRIIAEAPTFFRDLPVCKGAKEFLSEVVIKTRINSGDLIILTACPKLFYEQAAIQKRQWVYHNFGDLPVIPVWGGANKYLFMHQMGDILIDDTEKNLVNWTKAGGISVMHTGDFNHTRNFIRSIGG